MEDLYKTSVQDFLKIFRKTYPHIGLDYITDKEVQNFINKNKNYPLKTVLGYFEDFVLSQGYHSDVQLENKDLSLKEIFKQAVKEFK